METPGNKDFDSETEKKGLGTPATRAGIIEKLVSSGYAVRKGKQILPSTEGRELVNVMPAYLKSRNDCRMGRSAFNDGKKGRSPIHSLWVRSLL